MIATQFMNDETTQVSDFFALRRQLQTDLDSANNACDLERAFKSREALVRWQRAYNSALRMQEFEFDDALRDTVGLLVSTATEFGRKEKEEKWAISYPSF